MSNSYHLAQHVPLNWRGPRETIHYIGRKHGFFLLLRLLAPIMIGILATALWIFDAVMTFPAVMTVVAGVATAVAIGWVGWQWLDWSNDYVIITNRRVIYQERVVLIYESQREAPLEAIVSDDLSTTQWGRWFGFGNIIVRTFTGALILQNIGNPREVKTILAEQRARATSRGRRSRRQTMTDAIRQRLQGTTSNNTEASVPQQVKPGPVQKAMNNIFMMRWEKGNTIIYSTHWLMLLSKTWPYATIGLVLIAVMVWGLISGAFIQAPIFIVVVFFFLLVDVGFFSYYLWDWHNDQYIITPTELVDVNKKPLGREQRRSAPLESIQSINHERKNLIALIFNYGTVYIRVGEDTLTFDDVPDPATVQREIFDRFWDRKQARDQKSAETEQQRMVEWIEAYDDYRRGADTGIGQPPEELQE